MKKPADRARSTVRLPALAWWSACVLAGLAACDTPGAEQHLKQARQQFERGNGAAAAIHAKNALASGKDDFPTRMLLARALAAAGDLDGASAELGRARDKGAPPSEAALLTAEIASLRGQPAAVIQALEGVRLLDAPLIAKAGTLVAQAHRSLGDTAAARKALAGALQAKPDHVPGLALQAHLLADEGGLPAALGAAAELVQRYPADAAAWLAQGELLAEQDGAPAQPALASLRKALELSPRNVRANLLLVNLLLRQPDPAAAAAHIKLMRPLVPNLPVVDYLDGLAAFLQGDHRTAADKLELVLKRGEENAPALLLAGMAQARLGQLGRAESLLARALALDPQLDLARREAAGLLLRRGQPDKALALIEPLLGATSTDVPAWLLAGQAQVLLGRFAAADAAFARAARLRPADASIQNEVARGQLARGQVDQGLRILQAAAASQPQDTGSDLALVAAHMRRGDRDAANRALDAASAKRPDQALPWLLRGLIAQQVGQRAPARSAYETALKLEPRSAAALQALAALDVADGKLDIAQQRYESAIKRAGDSASLRLAQAQLLLLGGAPLADVSAAIDRSVTVDPLDAGNWEQAIALQRALGDPAAVLSRAQAAHAALPDDSTLRLELAGAQWAAGDARQALVTLRALIQAQPGLAQAHLRLATVLGMAGDNAAAREPMARALALAPDSMPVLRGAIALALADHDSPRALQLARAVQRRAPKLAAGWLLEAEIHDTLAQPDLALAARKTVFDKQPVAQAAVGLHRALLARGDAEQAARLEKAWREREPADAYFAMHLAETAARQGRAPEAEAQYRRALALAPDHAGVLNNLAELLVKRAPAEALALAERAAALAPAEPAVLDTLAAARLAAGKLPEAVAAQSRAVALAPGNAQLRLQLGRLWLLRGDRDKAREELRKVERSPDAALRDEATRLLRRIES